MLLRAYDWGITEIYRALIILILLNAIIIQSDEPRDEIRSIDFIHSFILLNRDKIIILRINKLHEWLIILVLFAWNKIFICFDKIICKV